MDNSLILHVVFGIRKHWKHLYKVLHCVFCFGTVFFFNEENIMFSALHFSGYGTRLKIYLDFGYVEPLIFKLISNLKTKFKLCYYCILH